ncbi:hypothetical protein Avbf_05268 [Armadillidium vulgare]|nr:hypothetical protein Avbf_05268 [Armadillidium vulgare]
MAESDAEWIDVDREFGKTPPRDPGPNRPPPRPRTTTIDHGAFFHQKTKLPDLQYPMGVVREDHSPVQKSQSDSQFCLRVEDVTHLDIDDSAKLYVNTTDLQKLVSSVRIKNKKLPPPVPFNNDFPDVVQVGRPPVPLPTENAMKSSPTFFDEDSTLKSTSPGIDDGVRNYTYRQSDSADNIYANVSSPECSNYITVARPAPPPPTQGSSKLIIKSNENSLGVTDEDKLSKQILKPPPPVLPKPTVNPSQIQTLEDEIKPKKEKPFVISKPKISPPNPPSNPKPSAGPIKPLLPRLKMNLIPKVNSQESEFSTPDTAVSYISDTAEVDKVQPELLSVKDKRAFLEGVLAGETLRKSS